jgi:predicted ATPase
MRLIGVKVKNLRGYSEETAFKIDPLTLIVGKNDAGKSTVLEALDIFFNDAAIDRDDCSKYTGQTEIQIACTFDQLPHRLVIDEQYPTSLAAEHLLGEDGALEIVKTYNCAASKGKLDRIFAIAHHPSADGLGDLLGMKIADLRKLCRQRGVDLNDVNETAKAQLRAALWASSPDLALATREVDLKKESGKELWDQISEHLPVYALFKSDRASTDQDSEAQDPLRIAVKEAIGTRETELDAVVADVVAKLRLVAERTVEKIREMSPGLADQLSPSVKLKNWDSLFSISLTGDDEIPINKRGSGTRRLVLLNFFRAMAEDASLQKGSGSIYAIEEPETSQHPNHQVMLLDAFQTLVESARCQVILTTHTPTLARRVPTSSLRMVKAEGRLRTVLSGDDDATLEQIKQTLGVLPDHDVKVFFGVEGKHDISFLKGISKVLSTAEADIPDLAAEEMSGRLVFVPLGGSSLELWVNRLAGFDRPEFYLTDRDTVPPMPPKYQPAIDDWTARGCTAWVTNKLELENYIHVDCIRQLLPTYPGVGADYEDVPMIYAEAQHIAGGSPKAWAEIDDLDKKDKASRAKRRLNIEGVALMTPDYLTQTDSVDEVRGWLRAIALALAR